MALFAAAARVASARDVAEGEVFFLGGAVDGSQGLAARGVGMQVVDFWGGGRWPVGSVSVVVGVVVGGGGECVVGDVVVVVVGSPGGRNVDIVG